MTINWHYPRTELAEQFLDAFARGATSSYTLFAPRRMGKTEFALRDLIPLAQERQYLTVYVNFWDRLDSPSQCILQGIKAASQQLSSSQTLLKWLDQISKIGIKTPLAGIDIGRDRNKPSEVELDLVADGLSTLLKNGKPLLLVLDEVQHLATNKEFEPLVFALRGLLDSQRQHIKVLFTGSSRNGLNQLFRRRKAPLFSSSQQIDLPELGSPFLEYLNHAFLQATGRSLRLAECQAAFRQLKKVPYDYQQVLDILMRAGHNDITSITQTYLQNLDQGDEHADIWKSLKAVDQAVLCCLLEPGYQGPYTPEANRFMAERLGLDQLDTATIQNALNRLKKNNIIASVGHGRYELEDPHLADWIRYQQDSES